jgi:hypothetical protein
MDMTFTLTPASRLWQWLLHGVRVAAGGPQVAVARPADDVRRFRHTGAPAPYASCAGPSRHWFRLEQEIDMPEPSSPSPRARDPLDPDSRPEAVPLESPMPRSKILNNEEPESADEADIAPERPARREVRDHARP